MKNKTDWIDVHNDDLMVELGIRPPKATPRDSSVWTKTPKEKKAIKHLRNKRKMHNGVASKKIIPVQDKLIIYLNKNKTFPNTVYSTICWQHDIPNVLEMFNIKSGNKPIVAKYYYNGKTYKFGEYPYWY